MNILWVMWAFNQHTPSWDSEMGISLHDLNIIGGLPILGLPYDEFIHLIEELCRKTYIFQQLGNIQESMLNYVFSTRMGMFFMTSGLSFFFFKGKMSYMVLRGITGT